MVEINEINGCFLFSNGMNNEPSIFPCDIIDRFSSLIARKDYDVIVFSVSFFFFLEFMNFKTIQKNRTSVPMEKRNYFDNPMQILNRSFPFLGRRR